MEKLFVSAGIACEAEVTSLAREERAFHDGDAVRPPKRVPAGIAGTERTVETVIGRVASGRAFTRRYERTRTLGLTQIDRAYARSALAAMGDPDDPDTRSLTADEVEDDLIAAIDAKRAADRLAEEREEARRAYLRRDLNRDARPPTLSTGTAPERPGSPLPPPREADTEDAYRPRPRDVKLAPVDRSTVPIPKRFGKKRTNYERARIARAKARSHAA